MRKETFIHNSGLTITEFYVEKLLLALGAGIAFAICYHMIIDDSPFWWVGLLAGSALLFISDAIVLAIGNDGPRFTFHHLWRQSSLDATTARFCGLAARAIGYAVKGRA
ncbi:hypothetical protein [Pseudodesulfovibrio indicus]|uniref:hypothetical protein n=1 Tax=Pseudodesulfovibrio indicus TaxID=1716143 RepID=UPI0029311762|nr:hypothetical protein [Pseudodesulfovibrio indicus]